MSTPNGLHWMEDEDRLYKSEGVDDYGDDQDEDDNGDDEDENDNGDDDDVGGAARAIVEAANMDSLSLS